MCSLQIAACLLWCFKENREIQWEGTVLFIIRGPSKDEEFYRSASRTGQRAKYIFPWCWYFGEWAFLQLNHNVLKDFFRNKISTDMIIIFLKCRITWKLPYNISINRILWLLWLAWCLSDYVCNYSYGLLNQCCKDREGAMPLNSSW